MTETPVITTTAPLFAGDAADLEKAWRDARADTADAYWAWSQASVAGRGEAYSVFLAAADREAAAERAVVETLRTV
jgi:hypothetical protein